MGFPRRRVARRGGFRRGTSSPTSWAGFHVDSTIAASSKLLLAVFVQSAGHSHETVVRQVGSVSIGTTTAGGAIVFGSCVVSDAAVAIGITAIPDPITEINDDLWSMIVPIASASQQRSENFDQRGMRKIEEGQSLVLVVANGGLSTVTFNIYYRLLTKQAIRS